MHGRADSHVPYDGGRAAKSRGKSSAISVTRSIGFWVDADGCDPQPRVEYTEGARIDYRTWLGCHQSAEVALYSIDDWGHEWPKTGSLSGFDASAAIWQFFERHQITP